MRDRHHVPYQVRVKMRVTYWDDPSLTLRNIADRFGVNYEVARGVCRGRSYKGEYQAHLAVYERELDNRGVTCYG